MEVEKFYPPFHISYIMQEPDKTKVKVVFYEIDEKVAKENIEKGENMGGKMIGQEVFILRGGLTAEEIRKMIYKKFIKERNLKVIKVGVVEEK